MTVAREALATLKPQAGAGTPMLHTPSHAQPPTPGHEPVQPPAHTMEATGTVVLKGYDCFFWWILLFLILVARHDGRHY